ncbi:MAG: heparinase II/III family protein [Phycisphaeraceae bacterium]
MDRTHLAQSYQQADEILPLGRGEWNDNTQRIADAAVEGRIEDIDVGRKDVDWAAGHWQHQEWHHRLNRFIFLSPLALAYQHTGHERYAEAARDYLADWLRARPPREDGQWRPYPGKYARDSTLNTAIRLHNSWLACLATFLASPAWDDDFVQRLLDSARRQLNWLDRNVPPGGNPRVVSAQCFLQAGLRLDAFDEAPEWRRRGVVIMNDCFRRLCLPDGAHQERDTHYHNWMKSVYESCWDAQQRRPELGFEIDTAKLARMHDFAVAARRPNHAENGMHDANGYWEGSQPPIMAEHRRRFREKAGLPDEMPATSIFFPHAGQAYLRTDWSEDADWMSFDATPAGGGHNHLSKNAVQLHTHGRTVLIDPGAINYDMSDPGMFYGKSTRAHCTVNVNGWNQFNSSPDWTRFFAVDRCAAVASQYSAGYWPGRFGWWFDQALGTGYQAVHTRSLIWIKGGAAVVIDQLLRWDEEQHGDHEPPRLEMNWKFSPGRVRTDREPMRAWSEHDDGNALLLFPQAPANATLELHEGETDPMRGWAGTQGRKHSDHPKAPLLTLAAEPWEDYETTYVTVIVPFAGPAVPDVRATVTPPAEAVDPWHVRIDRPDGSREEVFWTPFSPDGEARMIGRAGGFETDASIVAQRTGAQGPPAHTWALDGTWLRFEDENARPPLQLG